jgi:hypothetical protein
MKLPLTFLVWSVLFTHGLSDIQVTPVSSLNLSLSTTPFVSHTTLPIQSPISISIFCSHCLPYPTQSSSAISGRSSHRQFGSTSRADTRRASTSQASIAPVSTSRARTSRARTSRASTSQAERTPTRSVSVNTARPQQTNQNVLETSITALYSNPTPEPSSTTSSYRSISEGSKIPRKRGMLIIMPVTFAILVLLF